MSDFTELVDLAAERLGGSVLYATDDFFAEKENLLKPQEAVFIDGKYTDRGKWMDGWESRRKRSYAESSLAFPDSDYAIIRLGLSGVVRGVVVDTAFFKGNYPKACAIEGASIAGYPDVTALTSDTVRWTPILPRVDLKGDTKNVFAVDSSRRFTHLRLHMFPDGGIARLRVHGEVIADRRWTGPRARPQLVDLAAAEHGALVVACNDMFFGSRHNLIMPGRGVNMGDGWETKRSRREGPDWVVVRLAAPGAIERAIVDTLHFKGNAPDACAIDVASVTPDAAGGADPDGASDAGWSPLLPRTKLQPHTAHVFVDELAQAASATHVRLRIWPDGGISRLRLFGVVDDAGRAQVGMKALFAMPEPELEDALRSCCGSRAWVVGAKAIVDDLRSAPGRGDGDGSAALATLKARAADVWSGLARADWDEAFSAHPRIGETKAAATQSATAAQWSSSEQASVTDASDAIRDELRQANRDYESKFGRIYIVCATGKSVPEMLAIAKERMGNDPETELRRAAEEQRKITDLRLDKLVRG